MATISVVGSSLTYTLHGTPRLIDSLYTIKLAGSMEMGTVHTGRTTGHCQEIQQPRAMPAAV